MAKKHTFEIGPIEGNGSSKTAARDNAIERAAEALDRCNRAPMYIPAPASLAQDDGALGALVFPLPSGWCHQLVLQNGATGGWTSHSDGWMTAVRGAVRHLADLALDGTTGALAEVLQWHKDLAEPNVRMVCDVDTSFFKDMQYRSAWHAAYSAYRAQGFSDTEAHAMAVKAAPV